PDPATLRQFWNALDRLDSGVLWPRIVGEQLPGQGVREILAVATAAQAFQVCYGTVKYKKTEKDSNAREDSIEGSGKRDIKDAASSVASLLSGAAVGIGALSNGFGLAGASVAAVATSLFGNIAIKWSSKRSSKQERSLDYTFIVDRSVQ